MTNEMEERRLTGEMLIREKLLYIDELEASLSQARAERDAAKVELAVERQRGFAQVEALVTEAGENLLRDYHAVVAERDAAMVVVEAAKSWARCYLTYGGKSSEQGLRHAVRALAQLTEVKP